MLRITFLAIGLSALLFLIAYFFKKYQRGILWAAALILFIGTSLMLGLGVIKIVDNGVANHVAVFSIILSLACSGIYACGAEKIHEATIYRIKWGKVWRISEKCLPLQQQFPPRLLTMRTTAGLRHIYRYEYVFCTEKFIVETI